MTGLQNNQHNGASPWTPGPLAAFGEHKSEHGKFVYAVRETKPKGQIAGYPTPTARYRNRADAQLGALAPEMVEAILGIAGNHHLYLHAGQPDPCPAAICRMAAKLRALTADQEATR